MVRLSFVSFVILFLSSITIGQNSINDLADNHQEHLAKFLKANPTYSFRSQNNLADDYLKNVAEWFGKSLTPNYATGDFNGDKVEDFAVLLKRAGKPSYKYSPKKSGVDEHSPDFPISLIIFNGRNAGQFIKTFEANLPGPNASFINVEKKNEKDLLYYGVFETDSDSYVLKPLRSGYVMQSVGH